MTCAYSGTFDQFLAIDDATVIAALLQAALADGFSRQWSSQTAAWQDEIRQLREAIAEMHNCASLGWLSLEYEIARRGRRIDAVLIINNIIVVVEFKTGVSPVVSAGLWQVREYALDLRDFHAGSVGVPIVPVLVTPAANARPVIDVRPANVHDVIPCKSHELAALLCAIIRSAKDLQNVPIDPIVWRDSPYKPSLNIIEAAERIFAGQQVREISHATAENLTATVECIVDAVRSAQREAKRVICFLTGVPGAGKTLAGLSAVHDPVLRQEGRPSAVFLSGNGPLVRIVRTALVRDLAKRTSRTNESARMVSTFIQNVHNFLGHYAFKAPTEIPAEHVVIFDEAQRAWSGEQMQRKHRGAKSEAELMLDIMERLPDWAVIVALVGFGQEIHQGEAGLREWGNAVQRCSTSWSVIASPLVLKEDDAEATRLFPSNLRRIVSVHPEPRLHLATSIRSLRARMVSEWVEALLTAENQTASALFTQEQEFPMAYTRDLEQARTWLATHAGDVEYPGSYGLVASSGALRLRAYGLEVSSAFRRGFPYEEWFLATRKDVRSAPRLEVAATEFECQGLELDWVGVCWGGDLVFDQGEKQWLTRRFVGSRWLRVSKTTARRFLINKYRVLLTRARRGMILWIPSGSSSDDTLAAASFDSTAAFLNLCGIPSLL
jgi:hypothetical protein